MFRVTQYLEEVRHPTPVGPKRNPPGPVVIWNLIRRCNLACQHCYSISADIDFPGELSTPDIYRTMDDLKSFGVPVLILSGGEPLLHPDVFAISKRAKSMGFYVGLSTNGTMIDDAMLPKVAAIGYDYVGISLDGIEATHDRFRRKAGAYAALLELMESEDIDKFYLSHLNYGGRGNVNRKTDAMFRTTRDAMDLVLGAAWRAIETGKKREFVTGNNDADGVYLLRWVRERFPGREAHLRAKLAQWGGNSSGVNIANIDNLGNVHPDTFWWDYTLGNVKTRPFSEIWRDTSDPLMAGLKSTPRPVKGRCARCSYFDVCGGNTRVRAWQIAKDAWAEDPGCYLDDDELGIEAGGERLVAKPYVRVRRADAAAEAVPTATPGEART